MKKHLLTLLGICMLAQAHAQKWEFSVSANSGLFHYSGNSTTSTSYIVAGPTTKDGYTNDPWGNLNAASYGIALQEQYITRCGFLVGLQAGYDILRSRENINEVDPAILSTTYYTDIIVVSSATGHTILQNQLINLNPYIGYRISTKNISMDLMPGLDLGIGLSSHEYGSATTDLGTYYVTDLDRGKTPLDVRLRFGVALSYLKWGVAASYARGLTNYTNALLNDSPTVQEANAQLLRFGVSYRIF